MPLVSQTGVGMRHSYAKSSASDSFASVLSSLRSSMKVSSVLRQMFYDVGQLVHQHPPEIVDTVVS